MAVSLEKRDLKMTNNSNAVGSNRAQPPASQSSESRTPAIISVSVMVGICFIVAQIVGCSTENKRTNIVATSLNACATAPSVELKIFDKNAPASRGDYVTREFVNDEYVRLIAEKTAECRKQVLEFYAKQGVKG
jgi:hypothetical protein